MQRSIVAQRAAKFAGRPSMRPMSSSCVRPASSRRGHARCAAQAQPAQQQAPQQAADTKLPAAPLQPSGAWLQAALQAAASNPASLAAAAAVVLVLAAAAAPADASEAAQHGSSAAASSSLYDLAEGEEFWGNVAKYGRYFVTVMLGTGYVMVQPLVAAFKRPVSAVLALVALVGGGLLLKFTLAAMLGIQEPFSYESGSIVPYQ